MEFGIFHSGHVPTQPDPDAQRLAEHGRLLDEVAVAVAGDRAGFKYGWFTEHHFLEEYSHISASEVMMGFVAARTERLHLGAGIFNITPPVNHPARVAERVSMLDHLSEGRFEFGVGRGSSSTEYQGFGIPTAEETRDLFDETLPEVLAMLQAPRYSYAGPGFSMPDRAVLPRPWTVPHPPLWLACGSPTTFEKAGRLGMGALCFTMGEPEDLVPLIETYKTAIAQCSDPIGGSVNDNLACVSMLLCLDDRERAVDIFRQMGAAYYQSLVVRWLDSIPLPAEIDRSSFTITEPTRDELIASIEAGRRSVGTPEDVARSVTRWEEAGADQLIFGVLNNTLDVDIAIESIETFGRDVIPAFDRDPVHRTTRQREEQCGG
ncbi:MAG TPA: LLM class flavin-dependent oxidoreductase [Acidimicrobiia bacterium]|nr:LLM class flavin-dependent oxidoreductase [Acidimicrobiia bacterium]